MRQQLLGVGLGGLCQAWVRRDFPTPQGEQEFFSCLCPSRCVPPSSPAGGSGSGQGLLVSPLCCLPCSPAVGSVGKKRLAWKKRSRKANSGPGERGGLGQKQIGAAAETTRANSREPRGEAEEKLQINPDPFPRLRGESHARSILPRREQPGRAELCHTKSARAWPQKPLLPCRAPGNIPSAVPRCGCHRQLQLRLWSSSSCAAHPAVQLLRRSRGCQLR